MNIIKLAAFADQNTGGNPAGVALLNKLPASEKMQAVAAEVGFSETVFAEMLADKSQWRVRYFSPESEVAFCGHATIALGAALASEHGNGRYQLTLNDAVITVEGKSDLAYPAATLQSPPTNHSILDDVEVDATLALFGYQRSQLSDYIASAKIHGGANHYLIMLKSREDLAAMTYQLDEGREFMRSRGLVTIMFAVAAENNTFHVRNAFASGGVLEDPATGAAAAAFAGYLRDSEALQIGTIEIVQGEDMGARSLITANCTGRKGDSIRISGATRALD